MRLIDRVRISYPDLDLTDIAILLQIKQVPGFSVKDLAECLRLDPKLAQMKIAYLANTKRGYGRGAYKLITEEQSIVDQRKRSLSLTPLGEELAERLKILAEDFRAHIKK